MTMYRKTALIEATQWFKNGDHPDDHVGEILHDPFAQEEAGDHYARQEGAVVRYFRHPDPEFAGDKIHDVCRRTWHDHGWIDDLEGGHNVCPGDWIATGVQGEHWAIKDSIFAQHAQTQAANTDNPDDERALWWQIAEEIIDYFGHHDVMTGEVTLESSLFDD